MTATFGGCLFVFNNSFQPDDKLVTKMYFSKIFAFVPPYMQSCSAYVVTYFKIVFASPIIFL